MKKFLKTASIIIVIIIILILSLMYLKNWFIKSIGLDDLTKNDLCIVLNDSLTEFEGAADILTEFEEPAEYYITIKKASHDMPPFIELLFCNQMSIEGTESIVTKDFIKSIKKSEVKYILNKLDFINICATQNYVEFIYRTRFREYSSLIYIKDGKVRNYFPYGKSEHITGNWYYFNSD